MDQQILEQLKRLRAPFPDHQISEKPAPTKAQTEALRNDKSLGIRCNKCGQWHHRDATHLQYVGHAALTDRLLDVDPLWGWEPMATAPNGLPLIDSNGGMWIKLTVCGVTRLGYGDAPGKSGGDATKEVIGDALRNAGMRFGMALELWHKGELHVEEAEPAKDKAIRELRATRDGIALLEYWQKNYKPLKAMLDGEEFAEVEKVKDEVKTKHEAPVQETA